MIPGRTERGRGRPRGSGAAVEIPAVGLTWRESVPFQAGMRLWRELDAINADHVPTMADLSPLLTPGERHGLRDLADNAYVLWALIGTMHVHMMLSIERVRRS